jgi:hypothetical protein
MRVLLPGLLSREKRKLHKKIGVMALSSACAVRIVARNRSV